MSCADANRAVVLAENNRVGLDVLDHGPGEQHVANLLGRRCEFRDDFEIVRGNDAEVGGLHQQATRHFLEVEAGSRLRLAPVADIEQPHVFLGCNRIRRVRINGRCDDDLDKLPVDDRRGRLAVERSVERDDAAERRGRIRLESPVVGVEQRVGNGDPAGVRMFHDHAGRMVELFDALQRRIGIGDVVVGERLALQLFRTGERAVGRLLIDVERCVLVRVFAVAQSLGEGA